MSTIKQRINITAERWIEAALKQAAKRDGIPVASKAAELIEFGLVLEEDISLAAIARQRMSKKTKYLSHGAVWK